MSQPHRSGFVSILGRPNAGKSTLLNALVGQKVAITADKPQTTRTAIQGVLTKPEAQIVFIDTPGIHKADTPINKRMMEAVRASVDQRDLLLFLVDGHARFVERDRHAVDLVRKAETPAICVITKVDLLRDKAAMLPLIEQYKTLFDFAAFVPVSATRRNGLDLLVKEIIERLPEGPALFPEDYITDQPERFLAAELIREKILRETREEVPHSVAVEVDKWEETPQLTRIYATVRVERDGQKGIIIGARGSMLKKIGTDARQEMEHLFERRIYLDLHVRVQPDWREKPAFLNTLDWRTMAGEADEPET
jgi:GTP-binding protein Era